MIMIRPGVLVFSLLMLAGGWLSSVAEHPGRLPPQRPPLRQLSSSCGDWTDTGLPCPDPLQGYLASFAADRLDRIYERGTQRAEVHLWYSATRRPRNRLLTWPHTFLCPFNTLPRIQSRAVNPAPHIPVIRMVRWQEGQRLQMILYWLQGPGQTSDATFTHALWMYRQELLGERTDGCFVLIRPVLSDSVPPDETALLALAATLHDQLTHWLIVR